jgi:TonB-dependent receptor
VSGILSWSNPETSFGATNFGAYQKRLSAAASATSNDWNILPYGGTGGFLDPNRGMYLPGHTVVTGAPSDPNELVAIPNDSRYHYSTSSRETINGSATVQFRPVETLTFTADALYARNRLKEDRSDQTNWFNRPFDTVTFDSDPVVATAVKLGEGSLYGVKDIGFEQQHRSSKTTLYSVGLNAKWQINDQLTLDVDGNTSKSKSVPDSPNHTTSTLFSMGAPVVDAHSVDFTGPIPLQQWVLNDVARGNGNGQLDLGDLGTQQARTNTANQTHRVNQLRADLGWNFGGGVKLDLGGTYIDSKMLSTQTFTQQHLGDWGISHVGDVQQYAGDLVQTFCLQCKFDHYNPTNALIDFRGNAVDLLNALSPHYASLGDPMIVTGQSYDQVHEKVTAAYAQASWDGEIVGHKASLTGGLRWEDTKVTAFALVTQPSEIVWNADNDFSVVQSSQTVPLTKTGHYTNVLPAVDFKIEASRGLVARVSYSKTLARPEYQYLFASTLVTGAPNRPMYLGGVATGQTGNPNLKPLVSDNEDLSLEYYYGRSNYVSAGLFAKQVQNFVGIAQFQQSLFGLRDPSSGAPGTTSGSALTLINNNGIPVSDVSLFTMTALINANNGNTANALSQFLANYNAATKTINQAFVDQILGLYDVHATATDPLLQFTVATPINNQTANIHGFELQGQHFFGDTGFGVAGSLTKVFGDVGFDRGADPSSNAFALTGLSDSFNATAIYEKYGFSARLSYNWRGKFLAALNRGGSHNPVYFAPFGTLDGSISYNITPNASITFEAQNLTSEPIRTYARSTHQLWFAQELHPRFWFGARWRFGGSNAAPPPPPVAPPPPPATQTCPDGSVIEATATCPAPPPAPPPPPPPPPATSGERGN